MATLGKQNGETMYYVNNYVIDWDKVNSFGDIKRILMALDISFEMNNNQINHIEDLLILKEKQHKPTYD